MVTNGDDCTMSGNDYSSVLIIHYSLNSWSLDRILNTPLFPVQLSVNWEISGSKFIY